VKRPESLPIFRRRRGLAKSPGDSAQYQRREHAIKDGCAAARMDAFGPREVALAGKPEISG